MDSAFLFGSIPSAVVLVGLLAVLGAVGALLVAVIVRLGRRGKGGRAQPRRLAFWRRRDRSEEDPTPTNGAPPRGPSPHGGGSSGR